MAQKFLTSIDLTKNELQNAVIQNLGTAPATPVEGQIYYDTTDDVPYIWDGAAWVTWIPDSETANLLDRANHIGTQTASTISDFDTQVRTSRLDQMAAPTAPVSLNSQKITNLATPTLDGDATTKAYVDALVNGVDIHPSVKAATTEDVTLSGTQTIDGISLVATDRVLVKDQAAPEENGIYTVAAGAWARATDNDTWAEMVSAFVFVEEGTVQADTAWVATVDEGGTLNTTAITWTQFAAPGNITASNLGTGVGVFDAKVANDLQFRSILAASSKIDIALVSDDITVDVNESDLTLDNIGGALGIAKGGTGETTAEEAIVSLGGTRKYAASIGNGSGTSFAVNHALNTTDVIVMVKEVAGGLAQVFPDVVITDANNVTVTFTVAPTTNQYRVIVIG